MNASDIVSKSQAIRDELKKSFDFKENPIDNSLSPVLPYGGSSDVKLIIIGQDPTIQKETRRSLITHTLNLNKNGALKTYIKNISDQLGIPFENIYATNIFKYFYTIPPAQTMTVLQAHLEANVALLKEELSAYPKAIIITLGEPVLQLLAGQDSFVRNYWDHNRKTNQSDKNYTCCQAKNNILNRDFFPFVHIRSISKAFYKNHLSEYTQFVVQNKSDL